MALNYGGLSVVMPAIVVDSEVGTVMVVLYLKQLKSNIKSILKE